MTSATANLLGAYAIFMVLGACIGGLVQEWWTQNRDLLRRQRERDARSAAARYGEDPYEYDPNTECVDVNGAPPQTRYFHAVTRSAASAPAQRSKAKS